MGVEWESNGSRVWWLRLWVYDPKVFPGIGPAPLPEQLMIHRPRFIKLASCARALSSVEIATKRVLHRLRKRKTRQPPDLSHFTPPEGFLIGLTQFFFLALAHRPYRFRITAHEGANSFTAGFCFISLSYSEAMIFG